MRRCSWVAVVATFVLGLAVAAAVPPNANAFHGGEDHTLTVVHSGKCLDREYTLWFRGVKKFNPYDGAGVVQSTCASPGSPARICTNPSGCEATNQIWQIDIYGTGGPYRLRNKQNNKCLDVAGDSTMNYASVVQMPCNDKDTSQWWSASIERSFNGIPFHKLENLRSGLCLEVAWWSQDDAATVVQGDCSTVSNNQLWLLYNMITGHYGI